MEFRLFFFADSGTFAESGYRLLLDSARFAEEWAVVDNLSGGRVGVAFASGRHAGDFVLRPESYQERKSELLGTVELVQQLWRGEQVTFAGPEGKERAVSIFPRPVQAELPTWITSAGSTETFRAAGLLGANLLPPLLGQDRQALARNIAVYESALRDAHGPDAVGHVTLMLHTLLGEHRDETSESLRIG